MRQVHIAQVVLDMWLVGLDWTDVTALDAYGRLDSVQRAALANVWSRIEWFNAQNNALYGYVEPHPRDTTRRAIRKNKHGR